MRSEERLVLHIKLHPGLGSLLADSNTRYAVGGAVGVDGEMPGTDVCVTINKQQTAVSVSAFPSIVC